MPKIAWSGRDCNIRNSDNKPSENKPIISRKIAGCQQAFLLLTERLYQARFSIVSIISDEGDSSTIRKAEWWILRIISVILNIIRLLKTGCLLYY